MKYDRIVFKKIITFKEIIDIFMKLFVFEIISF